MCALTRLRVLLADDYPGFITAIARLLAQDGHEVVGTVGDGAQLVEEAIRLQPDLILLDLQMPNIHGIDACVELRRVIPRTKIIMLTAETDTAVRERVLAAGASAFITKQAVVSELPAAIERICADRD